MAFLDPTRWFANFKIPYKLLTISLSFLLPIGIMLYFIVQSVSGYIKFATFEQYGNAYQRPLEELLHYFPQHENLVRLYSEKDEHIREQILNVEAKIDEAIVNLEIINVKIGKQLQFTDEGLEKRSRSHFRAENVKAEWADLKKHYLTMPVDTSDGKHQHLVTDVLTMISHSGDISNLILDPDLDSYYLMDSTLLVLPQTQNRITNIIRDGEKALKDGSLTLEERQRFLIYASHLKESDLTRVLNDAVAYLNEDRNFYGMSPGLQKNIPPILKTYQQATQEFIELIARIANSETIDPSFKEEFASAGFKAREESFHLWNIAVDELDVLLVKRIAYYEHSRFLTLLWTMLFLMTSVFLVFFITKSILNPLRELMVAIDKISQGDLTWQVDDKLFARDEFGELSKAFNAMIHNLKNVTASRDELDKEISHRKLMEEELRKSYDELKQTQVKLFQSEKLASIGQLAAGVAHEINNPVGFISNNMEVLQGYVGNYSRILRVIENVKDSMNSGDMEKAKTTMEELNKLEAEVNLDFMSNDIGKLLEHSIRGLERIQKIVLDLRTFSREENTESLELVKVEEVVDSILNIVQSELKYKAELTKEYGDIPLVRCNAQRLGQVFINLLMNAAQAIEERGKIFVKTYRQDKYVCIDVSDTGKGIPGENLKKIFDPFFTTKPVGQGTGLGLSVSYEIVKKHGGDIQVKSKVGEGTTFTVMLPLT